MAIPVIGSNELNEKMLQADKAINTIKDRIDLIQSDIVKKMVVIRNEQQYTNELSYEIADLIMSSQYDAERSKIIFSGISGMDGEYEKYGTTIHPKFLRTPRNLFNVITSSGPLFRGNVSVYINDVISTEAKHILMHDHCTGKGIYFEELNEDTVNMYIEIDRSNLLGDTHVNVIEVNPYLAGSFDIETIQIKEMYSPDLVVLNANDLQRIGRSRIILDKKYELFSIAFTFKLRFKNNIDKYPFGIQSLQFLNAEFKNDSYIIAPVTKKENIEFIGTGVTIRSVAGIEDSTMIKKDITIYFDYDNGILKNEIELSEDDIIYPISRNVKTVYAHIPITTSLFNIEFNQVKTRL